MMIICHTEKEKQVGCFYRIINGLEGFFSSPFALPVKAEKARFTPFSLYP